MKYTIQLKHIELKESFESEHQIDINEVVLFQCIQYKVIKKYYMQDCTKEFLNLNICVLVCNEIVNEEV